MPSWLFHNVRVVDAPVKYEPVRTASEDVQEKEQGPLFESPSSMSFRPKDSHFHIRISKRIAVITSIILALALAAGALTATLSSRATQKPWPVPECMSFAPGTISADNQVRRITKVFQPLDDWEFGPDTTDLWSSVLGETGFIIVNDWEQYGLKSGLYSQVPGATIYGITATHQFHCLNMIRDAFLGLTLRDEEYVQQLRVSMNFSEPLAEKPRHIFHCLDYLRQTVMCNADTTLEWTSENNPEHIDGYGPPHQCKDWDEVRQWLEVSMPPDPKFHHATR